MQAEAGLEAQCALGDANAGVEDACYSWPWASGPLVCSRASVDLAAVTLFDAVGTESTLFAATCVELWSERRLTVLAQVITCPLPPPWP